MTRIKLKISALNNEKDKIGLFFVHIFLTKKTSFFIVN